MFTKKNNPKESQLNVQILEERFAYETRYLKKYFKINESSVKKHKEQIEISLLKEIKENPDKESQLNDFYENEIRIITSFYYHSSVVLVYTILENSLTQICYFLNSNTGNDFPIDSLGKRDNIGRAKEYLQLTTQLDFVKIEKVWPRICQFQKLRNLIVHQNSTLKNSADKEKLEKMFSPSQLSFDEKRFYILDETLVLEFIAKMEILIEEILNDIKSKIFIIEKNESIKDDLPF